MARPQLIALTEMFWNCSLPADLPDQLKPTRPTKVPNTRKYVMHQKEEIPVQEWSPKLTEGFEDLAFASIGRFEEACGALRRAVSEREVLLLSIVPKDLTRAREILQKESRDHIPRSVSTTTHLLRAKQVQAALSTFFDDAWPRDMTAETLGTIRHPGYAKPVIFPNGARARGPTPLPSYASVEGRFGCKMEDLLPTSPLDLRPKMHVDTSPGSYYSEVVVKELLPRSKHPLPPVYPKPNALDWPIELRQALFYLSFIVPFVGLPQCRDHLSEAVRQRITIRGERKIEELQARDVVMVIDWIVSEMEAKEEAETVADSMEE